MLNYLSLAAVCLILVGCVILAVKLEKRIKAGFSPYVRLLDPKSLRTQEEVDRMLAECIAELKAIGVPISDSISPKVVLNRSHWHYGECHPKTSGGNKTGYDYMIKISRFTLANTEKSIRNTILHELIHTVPGGMTHKGAWKKWADFASSRLGYNIKGTDGDETREDLENLRWGEIAKR